MKKKFKYGILILTLTFLTTGCTTYLKNEEGKIITNKKTGQNLVENILCKPEDEETIKLYEEAKYNLDELPFCVCSNAEEKKSVSDIKENEEEKAETKNEENAETKNEETTEEVAEDESNKCEELSVFNGKYEGLWTSLFVKPLAWLILFFGKFTGKFGLGLIITSILIRLVMLPLTKKTAVQTEKMKEIQPELNRLEKKYADKDQNDREVMMQKSQEMMMIYKKHNLSPMSGCLTAFIQLPLLMAFLDAINRVPAIFEENFIGFHLGTTPKIGIENGNWLYITLTILVAITTFLSLAKSQNNANDEMAKQTKTMMNVFTIIIIIMSIFMSSALNIYWIVSNTFTLLQNYIVKRSMK